MSELQNGILQYIWAALAFALGWLLRGLNEASKRRKRAVLVLEAERPVASEAALRAGEARGEME